MAFSPKGWDVTAHGQRPGNPKRIPPFPSFFSPIGGLSIYAPPLWFCGAGRTAAKGEFFAPAVECLRVGRGGPLPGLLDAPEPGLSHGARSSPPLYRPPVAVAARRAAITFLRLKAVHSQNHSVFTCSRPRSRN